MPAGIENQKPEEITSIFMQKPWRIFVFEVFLFFLSLVLGIATAFRLNKILKTQKISLPPISFWQFLLYFSLATIFIFILSSFQKFKKEKRIIFKTLFVLTVFLGGFTCLSLWLGDIFSFVLMGVLIFCWYKKPTILIHNFLVIVSIAGVGSVLGMELEPPIVILLLIIFSIYDFIAVYKTKHMIKLAKEMIEMEAILALIVPLSILGFKEGLQKIKPAGRFLILGGGDVVFPLLLSISLVPQGIINSLTVAIFSLIGLFVSFYIFINQKTRQPMPALPPIALFAILGYFIARLI